MYDTIIIGSGPAGMTAAIYAARREMKALVIGKELGGQVAWASEIENYPGFKSISNFELIEKMRDQVDSLGVEIKTAEVKKIEKENDGSFTLFTEKEKLKSKTVILAIGLAPRRLAIPGEEEFAGKGVSYCANCDGPMFKEKTVAVVGGGNAAFDAAEILSKIAKQVYLIHRSEKFKAFEVVVEEVKSRENIEMILNSEVKEITGNQKVEKIKIFNNQTEKETENAVDGIFIEIGRLANTAIVKDFAERNQHSQIEVDDKFQTKTEGLFAAGDVVAGEFKQITIACGQATIAALAAYQLIQRREGGKANVLDRSVHKKNEE